MITKTKILIGILVVVILAAGGWWIWNLRTEKIECSAITSMLNIEKCLGEKIEAVGTLECEKPGVPIKAGVHYLKFEDSTELRFLEEYPNCESYDGQKVKVVGEFYQCGELDQCAGVGLRNIKSVNLIFGIPKQEITIITDKTEYEQEKTISFTVFNGLNEKILISSCPQGEGFVEIEKQDADREWEEMILVICNAMCAGPINLEPGQSYTYAWRDFMTCLEDLIDFKPPGTYRVKFGYLTSLPYSDENTHWIYSNEFTIKEKGVATKAKNCDLYEMPMTEEQIKECTCPDGYKKFYRLSGAYCATDSRKPCNAHTDCPKGEHCISDDRKNWFCTGQFAGCYYRNPENPEEPMLCAD